MISSNRKIISATAIARNIFIVHAMILLSILFMTSCKKEDSGFSEVPEISFVSITPASQKEFENPFIITVSYKDGDGDLGENNPDVKNLFVKDNRIGITYEYRLQQLAPDNAAVPIQGTFTIDLPLLGITNGNNSQQATFEVYVTDRDNNRSNTIATTAVTITK